MSKELDILEKVYKAFIGTKGNATDLIKSLQSLTPEQNEAIDEVSEYVESLKSSIL